MSDRPRVRAEGTAEWYDWAARYARDRGQSLPELVEDALSELADSEGYDPPPVRLVPATERRKRA